MKIRYAFNQKLNHPVNPWPICLCIILLLPGSACQKDPGPGRTTGDYFVFGHFHGECLGESCIDLFRIQDGVILEDQRDQYPENHNNDPYAGLFSGEVALPATEFDPLLEQFPDSLWLSARVIGCPDCVDQGGYYIEYRKNGVFGKWLIDKAASAEAPFLKTYLELLGDKIGLLQS